MVTCTLQGGLGNTMFQIAACYGYAKKWEMPYVIPLNGIRHFFSQLKYEYTNLLNVPVYKEPNFHYDEIPYLKHVRLLGYFQSQKYFEGYEREIRSMFSLPIDETKKETICIHIRRGDYLTLPEYHCTPSLEYIESAIEYFRNKGYNYFHIISDDIMFCRTNFSDTKLFSISENTSAIIDMAIGASCAGMIGSASTFSWWISWLQNKESVFPKQWFGPKLPHDTKDLYLSIWKKL